MNVVAWAKDHPAEAGVGAFVVGLGILYALGFFSSSSSSNSSGALGQAYLQAQAATAQAGDQVQIAQIQGQNATAQTAIAAGASVDNNTTWANTNLQETYSNNAASTAIAPYAVQSALIGTLGQIASQPPTVTTSSSNDSGFFGIGGGSKTTQTITPNPAAASAAQLLGNLSSSFGNAGFGSSGYNGAG